MINAQISHSKEVMKIDLGLNLLTIIKEMGEKMEDFLALHRLKGGTSHKIDSIANQEVINLTILPSADLTIDPPQVLHFTNKSFFKTKLRPQLKLFASLQPMILLMNCQTSVF